MTTTAITTTAAKPRTSILAKMADRFSVEPNRLLDTLKSTAFKAPNGVTNEQMIALLVVADQYGLNPFTREVFAFPDKGGIVPVVSVDGWARIINQHPQFDGVEFSFDSDDEAMTCTIHRKDRAHPTVVTEYMSECKRNTQPWGSHPKRMLRHKSLIQCARVAFGFAGIYDEDEAQRIVHGGMVQEVSRPADSLAAVRAAIAGKQQASDVIDATPPEPQTMDAPQFDAAAFISKIHACSDLATLQLMSDEAEELPPGDAREQVFAALHQRDGELAQAGK